MPSGFYLQFVAGIAQLVEHNLAKVGVAGSSPVSRSLKTADDGRRTADAKSVVRRLVFPIRRPPSIVQAAVCRPPSAVLTLQTPGWRNWLDARDLKSLEGNLIRVRVSVPALSHLGHSISKW